MKGSHKILRQGLVHLYTGEGKGKTTAALGLAMRAAGAGLKVCVFQFLKGAGRESSELRLCRCLSPRIKVVRFKQVHPLFSKERRNSLRGKNTAAALSGKSNKKYARKLQYRGQWEQLKQSIARGLGQAAQIISDGQYDLVILDEIVNAVSCGLVKTEDVLDLIKNKPAPVELVLTGRGATPGLKKHCDYVTEMKLVRHPYQGGIKCRRGIEF